MCFCVEGFSEGLWNREETVTESDITRKLYLEYLGIYLDIYLQKCVKTALRFLNQNFGNCAIIAIGFVKSSWSKQILLLHTACLHKIGVCIVVHSLTFSFILSVYFLFLLHFFLLFLPRSQSAILCLTHPSLPVQSTWLLKLVPEYDLL